MRPWLVGRWLPALALGAGAVKRALQEAGSLELALEGDGHLHHVKPRGGEAVPATRGQRWAILDALADNPPGAYAGLLGPATMAVFISYHASYGPMFMPKQKDATIPSWRRLRDVELNPVGPGIHAFAFADDAAKRCIVAFKGSCQNPKIAVCKADRCVLERVNAFGAITKMNFGTEISNNCSQFGSDDLDYFGQADRFVRKVQSLLPDYSLLLTGHSMGGMLASVTAARQPGALQAMTFAPSPFHTALQEVLNMTEAQIRALPAQDLVSTCDPFDCGINSWFVRHAREGTTTCLYFNHQEPDPCERLLSNTSQLNIMVKCKKAAHFWGRYMLLLNSKKSDGSPLLIPNCSLGFSGYDDP